MAPRKGAGPAPAAKAPRPPSAKQVIIENPILNSPFEEPRRHYRFDDDGITEEIVEARRASSYFVPIAVPRKKTKQLTFDTLWTQDRAKENAHKRKKVSGTAKACCLCVPDTFLSPRSPATRSSWASVASCGRAAG